VVILFSGCSIKQDINAVSSIEGDEICIVNNPPVRPGFLSAMNSELTNKGYKAKVIPQNSSYDSCPTVSTYHGLWSWDLAIYLSYANIKVFQNGEQAGEALYDARSGGGNMNKFINGEKKVRELTNLLFPPKK
jgi:hypothetical protein